jgi:hypothetical protein
VPQSLRLCKLCDVGMEIKTNLSASAHLTGEAHSSRYRAIFPLNEWPSEVERDILPLDPVKVAVNNYLAATISRSSTSNTNVAPGLIEGGAPLSP